MHNFILSLEGQFPTIYSQSKLIGNSSSCGNGVSSMSPSLSSQSSSSSSIPTGTDEILPNKLPLKRRLAEFRFGRDGGSVSVGKKNVSTFTTNPFAFDKFKDITTAVTIHLHPDGIILDPGSVGPLPYNHPTVLHLLNSINTGTLPLELFMTLLEQSQLTHQQLFYDGCVVVGVVEWRPDMALTIGNVTSGATRQVNNHHALQWTRRVSSNTEQTLYKCTTNNQTITSQQPELHKVLLKPAPDCWQYALSFLASQPDGANYAKILGDDDSLLEFERQLILINEPLVCLDPSPMVMYAMNALYFDQQKHRLFQPLTAPPPANNKTTGGSLYDELDQTLFNFAALKPPPNRSELQSQSQNVSGQNTPSPTPTVVNPRYRRITLIESLLERDRRRSTEPIYGIDHRRQFVKNRQPLPPSSFVPANWRPFKTIRYEREINGGAMNGASANTNTNTNTNIVSSASTSTTSTYTYTSTPSTSTQSQSTANNSTTAKLYYCVNVFYAPPPVFPPIQLFLQVGTSPDTSISGFLHRLQFPNLIETENYLQNLRNLLLIENGNCNLKVVTDISTTTTTAAGASVTGYIASNIAANVVRNKGNSTNNTISNVPSNPPSNPTSNPSIANNSNNQSNPSNHNSPSNLSNPVISIPVQPYQLTPHQILQQLNQQRSKSRQ